jgi:hypothetical protein
MVRRVAARAQAVDSRHGVLAFAALAIGLLLFGGGLGQGGAMVGLRVGGQVAYDFETATLLATAFVLLVLGVLLAVLALWIRRGARWASGVSVAVAVLMAGVAAIYAPFLGLGAWLGSAAAGAYAVAALVVFRSTPRTI